jgi:predicted unusual protein kinase regulating ubiquinone biosynthesis (AarF/ABC1/UbiB family)
MHNLYLDINVVAEDALRRHREAINPTTARHLPYDLKSERPYRSNLQLRQLIHRLGHAFVQFGQWLEQRAAQPQNVYPQPRLENT